MDLPRSNPTCYIGDNIEAIAWGRIKFVQYRASDTFLPHWRWIELLQVWRRGRLTRSRRTRQTPLTFVEYYINAKTPSLDASRPDLIESRSKQVFSQRHDTNRFHLKSIPRFDQCQIISLYNTTPLNVTLNVTRIGSTSAS